MGEYSSPASWTVTDVVSWATQTRLGPTTIAALEQNEVDGPTLVTLTKTELQTELGISSLSARRYLWDLIKSLRLEQDANDYMKKKYRHWHYRGRVALEPLWLVPMKPPEESITIHMTLAFPPCSRN